MKLAGILLVGFGLSMGCGSDDGDSGGTIGTVGKAGAAVGGPCGKTSDCSDGSICKTEGDFPGGMCVIECDGPSDCPAGSRCASNESGICMPSCASNDDCRTEYECDDVSNEGADGHSMVCKNGS